MILSTSGWMSSDGWWEVFEVIKWLANEKSKAVHSKHDVYLCTSLERSPHEEIFPEVLHTQRFRGPQSGATNATTNATTQTAMKQSKTTNAT